MSEGITRKTFLKENSKVATLLLQWLLFIMSVFLILYTHKGNNIKYYGAVVNIIAFFGIFNLFLTFMPLRYFVIKMFGYGLFLINISVISLIIYFSEGFYSDLYLIYFLIILIASMTQTIKGTFLLAFISSALYFVFLWKGSPSVNFIDTAILMRIPFLFVISFVATFFKQESEKVSLQKAEVERYNEILQEKINQATKEIQKFHDMILESERVSMIKLFTSEVAHELNNPLTYIEGYMELIREGKIKIEDTKELNIMYSEILRCKELIKQLLNFSRETKIKKAPVAIKEVIEKVLEMQAYQYKINNILIEKDIQEDLPLILGNFNQLQQVFMNLFINAKQSFESQKREKKINIKVKSEDNRIEVYVSDNGSGISKENLEKIFEPFFTTKDSNRGAGLGLHICSSIIREHGGKISVTSEKNVITTFKIELPVIKQ